MIDPIIRTVGNMMARFGGNATLIQETGTGTYDSAASKTTPSQRSYTIRMLAMDYIKKDSGIIDYHGTLIQTGDKQMFIKPDPAIPAPRVDDSVIYEGKKWRIVVLKNHNPSGANAYLYEAYLRQ
jgi:hypothetical protein